MKRRLVVLGALGVLALVPSSHMFAATYPVMCQASAKYAGSPAPYGEFSFRARMAGGQPPYLIHWDYGDGASSTDHTASPQTFIRS